MDAEIFERVYDSLQEFHAFFAASFGRKQWREHSGNYLQALLVQDQERRNAENLSESVGVSARAMQRFLTEARWSDETVIGRLQEYLAPRLGHPEAVWVLDGSDFPKQGRKSAGVARQYCGRLGKVANCQAGMFLAYVSPLGRALVDKRLYLPESWTSDKDRCEAAGVPEDRQGYRSKTELALEMVGRAQERGHLKAGWVAADDAFGMSPSFRDGLAAPWGCGTCWTFRPALRCGRRSLPGPVWSIRDSGVPASRGSAAGSGGRWRSGPMPSRRRRGVRLRWLREVRDHAATCSVPRGCVQPAGVSPAKSTGPFTAGIWTAANPATICPMLRRIPRWRPWHTWEDPVGVYETRTWA